MIVGIIITLSVVLNVLLIFFLSVFIRRASEYDYTLESIYDDMDIFVNYSDELLSKSFGSMSPDVINFSKNLRQMRNRMDMHIIQSHHREKKKKQVKSVNPNPPVTVD